MLKLLWSNDSIHDVNGTAPCVEAWSRFFNALRDFFRKTNVLSVPRSSEWNKLRLDHLKRNPSCAVCGNKKGVVPHHIIPFHEDPSKELDPENLITLCEGDTFNCHLFFGHLRNWTKSNPDVVVDAKIWNEKINKSHQSECSEDQPPPNV